MSMLKVVDLLCTCDWIFPRLPPLPLPLPWVPVLPGNTEPNESLRLLVCPVDWVSFHIPKPRFCTFGATLEYPTFGGDDNKYAAKSPNGDDRGVLIGTVCCDGVFGTEGAKDGVGIGIDTAREVRDGM